MAELFNPLYPDPPVTLKVAPRNCKECGRPFVPVSKTGTGATHCPDCRKKITAKAREKSLEVRAANKAATEPAQPLPATEDQVPAFETMVEWYRPEELLPEKSGEYLTVTRTGHYSTLAYSDTYKKFNVLETHTPEEAEKVAIRVVLWAYTPEILNNYANDIWEKEYAAEKAAKEKEDNN